MHETIKRLMERSGHTPTTLAARLGINISSVYFWTNPGQNNKLPRPAHLYTLLEDARLAPIEELAIWRELARFDEGRG